MELADFKISMINMLNNLKEKTDIIGEEFQKKYLVLF